LFLTINNSADQLKQYRFSFELFVVMTFFKRLAIPLPLTAAKLDVYNKIKLHMLLDWLIQASNEFQRGEASAIHLPAKSWGSSMNEH